MNKLKLPHVGFILIALAFILTLAAFILTFIVYRIFGYNLNRWLIFLSVAALWLTAFLLVNSLFAGDNPFWTHLLYGAICIALTFSAILFIQPVLAPMGVYFTVAMGDVETNAAGVPRAIVAVALYVAALFLTVAASFFRTTRDKRENKGAAKESGV